MELQLLLQSHIINVNITNIVVFCLALSFHIYIKYIYVMAMKTFFVYFGKDMRKCFNSFELKFTFINK